MNKSMKTEKLVKKAERELDLAFKNYDTDGSGFLERNEFTALFKSLMSLFNVEEPSYDDIEDILKLLDTSGDGKISRSEFDTLIEDIIIIIKEEKLNEGRRRLETENSNT